MWFSKEQDGAPVNPDLQRRVNDLLKASGKSQPTMLEQIRKMGKSEIKMGLIKHYFRNHPEHIKGNEDLIQELTNYYKNKPYDN